MTDSTRWIAALRRSHDDLAALTNGLTPAQAEGQSYDDDWSIGQVASHLGSGAEIFALMLQAGLLGGEQPDGDVFQSIWGRWNAMSAADQVSASIDSNERLVAELEAIDAETASSFALSMFGMDLDLAGFAAMRYGEHAVHRWDIAVALDPTSELTDEAAELLVDRLGMIAGRATPVPGVGPILVATTEPTRGFSVTLDPSVSLEPAAESDPELTLPAAAFVRLVYGRLDPKHTPDRIQGSEHLDTLRTAFPGF